MAEDTAAAVTEQSGERFPLKHRTTGDVLFWADIPAELRRELYIVKLGAAIKLAWSARANLAGAYMAGADLAGANLARANLAGANLAGANLARANLARANLARANMAGADLTGANLAGANLARAKDVIAAGQPNGLWTFGYRGHQTGALRVKVDDRDETIAEARRYWSESHPRWSERQEIPPALDLIETIARLRGWTEAA